MKKLLLSVLMSVVCFVVGAAQEKTVTFDFANEDYGLTRISDSNSSDYLESGTEVKSEPVTLTLTKTEGTNGMRLWTTGLRFHRNSDAALTVSVPEGCTLTQITFTTGGTFALADGEAGEYSSKTWTGSANSVKFNYTATSNKDITKLVVYYTQEAEAETGSGFELVEGDGTKEKPFLVSQIPAGQQTFDVWVAGYVVGHNKGNFFGPNPTFGSAEGAEEGRFLLAPTPDTNALAGCLDVMSINNEELAAVLDLQSNPDNIGKIVVVYCGTITATMMNGYFTTQNITDGFIPEVGGGDKPETYTLTINANGCEYQLVGAEDLTAIEAGTEFVFGITEIPAGKILKAVKLNGVALEGESVYEFTVTENSVLDIELVQGYQVNILQNEGGTLKVMNGDVEVEDGTYLEGETFLTLVATPDEGYALRGYTYNGNPLTDDMVIVEEDFTVSAEFEKTETKVEYVAPAGTTKSANYLTSLSTTGATEDINKEWTSHPGIYNVLEEAVTAKAGSTFTLNLVANSLGEGSNTVVREDIRFTAAHVFVDWYGTGNFEFVETVGKIPPTHNVYGNYDEVMNIAKEFTVPEDVEAGTAARIRVIYANAWTVPGETGKDQNGTPYANSQYIDGGIVYDIVVNTPAGEEPPVETVAQTFLVPEGGSASGQTVYSFRFDDAPLGSHTNGTNDANDLRSRTFTYSAWVNVRSTQGGVVMGNIQNSFSHACGAFLVTLKNGKLCLNGRDATELSNFKDMTGSDSEDEGTNENEWVFVSVVADQEAGTVTLYKNAKAISSFTTTYGIGLLPDQSCFFIGDAGTSVEVSEVQLWTKAMTPAELKAAYSASYTEAPEGLVAYYKGGELVEGSTTELRNLGTEATTTAKVFTGKYNLIGGWNPQYQAQLATEIQHNEGTHEYKIVSLTLNQPEGEGNSFTVVGKEGREISDEAYLYETLTVQPTLAEGYSLVSVDVVESNGTENHYTLDQMPFLAEDDLTISLTLDAPAPEVAQHIVIPARDYSRNELATFRFDDVVLGSHTNGVNNDSDQRSRNLTYSAWINIKSASNGDQIMGNIQSLFTSAVGAFNVYYKDGKLNLQGRNATSISNFSNATPSASTDEGTPFDEWVFVSVVADQEAGTVTLYKNAKPISSYSTTYGVGLLTDEADFFIGDMGASVAFTEVQLWTKALTPAELKAAYHASYEEAPEGLVAYYKAGKLVEGSTTELANLGTEGTTTATVRDGRFGYSAAHYTNVISNLQPMDLDHQEGSHVYKTVNVTLNQPEGEGNSFTVVGKEGREISDEAYLYETLTVQPTLAEGYSLVSVDVVEDNGTENHYTLDQMPFLAEDHHSISLTLKAPAPEEYKISSTVENGSVNVSINNVVDVNISNDYWMVPTGASVVVTLSATNDTYELKSFKINGEDAMDQLDGMNYTIAEMDAEYDFEVVFAPAVYRVKLINPETGKNGIYGEIVNGRMQHFEDEDEELGVGVPKGQTAYLILYTHPDYEIASVTDNDKEVKEKLYPYQLEENVTKSYFYPLNQINSDRTIVITQDKKVGIFDINADGENAISYVDGQLNVPANAVVEVYDMAGRKVASAVGALSVDELVNGVYVARAAVEGKIFTLKFVKF